MVWSPNSTTICASTPSAVRYADKVPTSMSPWRSIFDTEACPTPGEMFTMDHIDPEQTYGLPHDGMEPNRRSVRWVIDQSADAV
jgi:hypothetical protein